MTSKWHQIKADEAQAARLYAATKPANATPSRTYVNSTTQGAYTGHRMGTTRPGADQHKQYTGAGFRAQIERS